MTERLTKRNSDGSVGINDLRYYNYDDFQKMAKKLAHYEDLEERCLEEYSFGFRTLMWKWSGFYEDVAQFVKWRNLEEQGRLLVLPKGFDKEKLFKALDTAEGCPDTYGLEIKETCSGRCYECWEKALKGE